MSSTKAKVSGDNFQISININQTVHTSFTCSIGTCKIDYFSEEHFLILNQYYRQFKNFKHETSTLRLRSLKKDFLMSMSRFLKTHVLIQTDVVGFIFLEHLLDLHVNMLSPISLVLYQSYIHCYRVCSVYMIYT